MWHPRSPHNTVTTYSNSRKPKQYISNWTKGKTTQAQSNKFRLKSKTERKRQLYQYLRPTDKQTSRQTNRRTHQEHQYNTLRNQRRQRTHTQYISKAHTNLEPPSNKLTNRRECIKPCTYQEISGNIPKPMRYAINDGAGGWGGGGGGKKEFKDHKGNVEKPISLTQTRSFASPARTHERNEGDEPIWGKVKRTADNPKPPSMAMAHTCTTAVVHACTTCIWYGHSTCMYYGNNTCMTSCTADVPTPLRAGLAWGMKPPRHHGGLGERKHSNR